MRYALTEDGVTIAYSVLGEAAHSVVLVSPAVSHLEVSWEEPALEHFLSRLATGTRLLLFDRRGTGLSDRSTASNLLDLRALGRDIAAVLDATGTDAAVVFGVTFGCQIAVQFAADYPQRTRALILAGGAARITRLRDYDFAAHPEQIENWADETARSWGTGALLTRRDPQTPGDARYQNWAGRLERHTCSPGAVAALCRWIAGVDVRAQLDRVRCPTLVLHRRDDRYLPVEDGRYLAAHIPAAVLAELPGDEHTIFLGDQRAALDAIVTFLDDAVADGTIGRALRRADRRHGAARGWHSLTPAETELAELVSAGLTNAEIATRLHISRHTVDGRLRRVFVKLGVNTRVGVTAERARVRG